MFISPLNLCVSFQPTQGDKMAREKLKPMKPKKGDTTENLLQRLLVLDEYFDVTIDVLEDHDWGGSGCYGYTEELKGEIEELKKRLKNVPDEMPEIQNLMDQTKYDFFVANFAKIPLEALEWIVSTVDKNKLTV
jgi:hypothetical protein